MEVITKFYQYAKISMLFWFYLFKGFFVYGILPSTCSLIAVTNLVKRNKDDKGLRVLFAHEYKKYSENKIFSFIIALVLIISYSLLFFVVRHEGSLTLMLIVILIYILGIALVFLTYIAYFLVNFEGKLNIRQMAALSFVSIIKYFGVSFILLCLIGLIYAFSRVNFLLFILFAPVFYAYIITIILKLVEEKAIPKNK